MNGIYIAAAVSITLLVASLIVAPVLYVTKTEWHRLTWSVTLVTLGFGALGFAFGVYVTLP